MPQDDATTNERITPMIPEIVPDTPDPASIQRFPITHWCDVPSRCDAPTWHLWLTAGCDGAVRVPQTAILHTLSDVTADECFEYAEVALPDLDSIAQQTLRRTRADELLGFCLECGRMTKYREGHIPDCGHDATTVYAPVGGVLACGCDEGAAVCRQGYYGAACACGCHVTEAAGVLLAA